MATYKELIFTPAPKETPWTPVSDRHAILNTSVEFRLHNGDTHLGYRMEMQPVGRGYAHHAFGIRNVYVAESDGADEFFPSHHVVEWRQAKPFSKDRFLGVCDSDEEDHLGRLSSMFINYIHLAFTAHRAAGTTDVSVVLHQTRHRIGADDIEYWETFINVQKDRVTRTVTMQETDLEDQIVFKQPNAEDQSFRFTQLNEAVDFIMNSVF